MGAESDWRSANTESMKSTFTKEAGYDLIFEDGQQKQANQIRAIRTFIQQEVDYIVLAPVTETAHVLDTTRLLPSQLRRWVQQFVKQPAAKLTLTFESFGYKRGLPYASDLVFDVRCLPNPYYSPELRPLTGLDAPVASYLAQEPLVSEMIDDIAAFIAKWLPHYRGQIATTSPSALAVPGDSTDRYMLQKCLDADLPIKPAQLSVIERFQPICSRKISFRHYKRLRLSIRAKRFLHTPVPASAAQATHQASRRRA